MPRPYSAFIYDTQTGETRTVPFYRYGWDENTEFLWSEGNYSCDCNRHIHFASVRNESAADRQCGQGRFFVFLTDAETHEVLYADAVGG